MLFRCRSLKIKCLVGLGFFQKKYSLTSKYKTLNTNSPNIIKNRNKLSSNPWSEKLTIINMDIFNNKNIIISNSKLCLIFWSEELDIIITYYDVLLIITHLAKLQFALFGYIDSLNYTKQRYQKATY